LSGNDASPQQVRLIGLRTIHALGSLRLAAVLILVLLVAMAYATIYEQSQGLARTRDLIYDATWFHAILALIAANTLLAIVVRWPIERRQIGFVVTHLSILVILAGAVITGIAGDRGTVTLLEGESTDRFAAEDPVLMLVAAGESDGPSVPLKFATDKPLDGNDLGTLQRDGVTARIVRYYPDARLSTMKDDNPTPSLAVEVTVQADDAAGTAWVPAGRRTKVGPMLVALREVQSLAAVETARAEAAQASADAKAYLEITVNDQAYPIALAPNIGQTVPIGDSGYAVEINAYYRDAKVRGGRLVDASNKVVNPAAEVHIVRDGVRDRRRTFAFVPGMGGGAGRTFPDVDVALKGIQANAADADVILFALPGGAMHALCVPGTADPTDAPVTLGTPLDTPWSNVSVIVNRRYDHARIARGMEPVIPPRGEKAEPAVDVEVTYEGQSEIVAVRRYTSNPIPLTGNRYRLEYRHPLRPLGFQLTLEKFMMGTYPGSQAPLSYASRVRIQTPDGRTLGGKVEMNAPLVYGGYTLFQTSYGDRGSRWMSTLSVVHDPGMWVVFVGYGTATLGMIIVLVTRIQVHRRNRQLVMN
jgi:hypothetical protein